MLEVMVNHLGAVQFEAKARKHSVYCDQPVENGGFDEGMTPPEFLLAAVGTCAGYYVLEFLRSRKLPETGLSIRTTAEKASAPARLDHIRVEVHYPHDLEDRVRAGMLNAVHKCLIHNTLKNPPQIDVEIDTQARVPAAGALAAIDPGFPARSSEARPA